MEHTLTPVYELAISMRTSWQAHSLSNAGNNGSNRLLPRRQLLSTGVETDACSGNIAKHYHAMLLAEYLEEQGVLLCAACAARDGRRAAALVGHPGYVGLTMDSILNGCGLCDAHGFLVTAKNERGPDGPAARQRLSKHSLIEFSFALALPGRQQETVQLMTRVGDSKEDGQMLMKMPSRSGEYAWNIRYKAVGIGIDTDKWTVKITDQAQRLQRHRAILSALRDQVLSPSGALTATMLPHLVGVVGAIVIRTTTGRASLYSALENDFITRLQGLQIADQHVIAFDGIDDFSVKIGELIMSSYPCFPSVYQVPEMIEHAKEGK